MREEGFMPVSVTDWMTVYQITGVKIITLCWSQNHLDLLLLVALRKNSFHDHLMQVKYLQIAKKSSTYKPYRWVRYVTQANSYVARLWKQNFGFVSCSSAANYLFIYLIFFFTTWYGSSLNIYREMYRWLNGTNSSIGCYIDQDKFTFRQPPRADIIS